VFGSAYGGMDFPPELPEDCLEPMGIDYGRYKEWERIELLMRHKWSFKPRVSDWEPRLKWVRP
jgi:hypothetical protein